MATRAGASAAGFAAIPNSKNFYKRLGVTELATPDQIRSAYKKLVVKYHPDKNNTTNATRDAAEIAFKNIGEAYEKLSNSIQRTLYDKELLALRKKTCRSYSYKTDPYIPPEVRRRYSNPYNIFNPGSFSPSPPPSKPRQPKGLNFVEKENDIKMDIGFYIGSFLSRWIGNPKSDIPSIDYISARDLGLDSYEGLRFEHGPEFLGSRLDISTRSNHDNLKSLDYLYCLILLKYTKEIKITNLFTKGGYDIIERTGTIEVYIEKKDFGSYQKMIEELRKKNSKI